MHRWTRAPWTCSVLTLHQWAHSGQKQPGPWAAGPAERPPWPLALTGHMTKEGLPGPERVCFPPDLETMTSQMGSWDMEGQQATSWAW